VRRAGDGHRGAGPEAKGGAEGGDVREGEGEM